MAKKIIIVGAGPGGLTASMILAYRGFNVEVYEKNSQVGGRNAAIVEQGYSFDIGPTFLMMKFILEEVFKEAGRNIEDYLTLIKLDPMYRLVFADKTIDMTDNHEQMKQTIGQHFPGQEKQFDRFLKKEKQRFEKMYPCLQKPYHTPWSMLSLNVLKALPYLSLTRSMFEELGRYFNDEQLKISFTFQSKYLGMSPWDCPAAFMIIPYIEHTYGIYHVQGGLSKISEAMANVAKEHGATISCNTKVKQLLIEGNRVVGVLLEDGTAKKADETIINADFAYAMENLVPDGILKKYSKQNLAKKKYSCSTFMLYLGMNKLYDLPHHTIVFSKDYKTYINNVFQKNEPLDDLSFYIRNASVVDKTLAPQGKANVYVLVPVQNLKANIDWEKEKKQFRDKIIATIKQRLGFVDFEEHIEFERIITPKDWEQKQHVYLGATFNLAHNLNQMLYFRPHNQFEELKHCYLVGGGTHPGSGLPTIYESGRITANLIAKKYKIPYTSFNLEV
ncbi:MAG: phytoene desaturase family protein [Candidatus Woesearchaeota archaeon]